MIVQDKFKTRAMRKQILLAACMIFCYGLMAQSSEVLTWYTTGKSYQSEKDFKNAVKSYAKAVDLCPAHLDYNDELGKNCINSYFNIGVCAQQLKNYKIAETQFSIVLKHMPSDHESYARRGACRTELKKKKKALGDLEKAFSLVTPNWHEIHPSTKYWYTHDLALAYRNVNRLNDAISYIDKAIAIQDGAAIRIEKAKILLQMGRIGEVDKELDAIRDLGAAEVDYSYIQGLVYMFQGEYNPAISYFEKVENEKEIKDALRHMTYCYIQLNYMDAARKHLQLLKTNNFSRAEVAWLSSQLATKEGRWEDALDFADRAESDHIEFDTILQHVRLQRARIHYRQGDFNDAIGESNLVLAERPMDIEASTLKGLAYLELGERNKAGDILIAMANHYPDNPMVESRMGWYQYRIGQKDLAAQKFLGLVKKYPKVAEIRYYYAEISYQMEAFDPRECNASLDVAIGLDPTMEEAYSLKARILHENGETEKAMMFLNRAEDLGLIHSYSSANAARIYLDKGEYAKALQKSNQAIRDADELVFQRIYGLALGYNGNWNEAIEHLDYCISVDANDWQTLKARAFALSQIGEHRKAARDYNYAIQLSPNDSELYNARGKTLSMLGKYSEAIADLDRATSINPYFTDAYYQKGRMYLDQRDYSNASFHLEQALSVAKNDSDFKEIGHLYNDLGLAKAELDDSYGALGYYNKGIELDPNDLLYENRARLHSDLGENNLAMEDYQRAINISGKDPQRYFELGKIQRMSTKFWDASSSFTSAIQIKISTRQEVPLEYYRNRGECYLAMGGEYLSSAEGDFLQLKERDHGNWQPLYYLGKCKYDKGDFSRAVQYFTDAISMDNQQEEVYIARGDAFSMMEVFGNAALDYGAAISLNPEEVCYYKKKGHAHLRDENWIGAIKDYDEAIAVSRSQGMTAEAELYHGKGRAYTGKAYAETSDIAFELAIDNYNKALYVEGVSEQEKYYIQLNMMTTYEKWGNTVKMNEIRSGLNKVDDYREPAVLSCS